MHLKLHLLGPPEVCLGGELVTGFVSDKARALLFYLAVQVDRAHRRETLAGLLWPDYPERSARTNLSNTLSNLRTVLNDRDLTSPFLLISRETIQFNAHSDHWFDAIAFDALVDGERWEEAIALYQDGFLEGFSLPESAPFEQWVLNVRERLQRRMMAALEGRAAECEGRGDYAGAQDAARRQLELEPWHEGAHRALMRALALSGERSAALAQYEQCRRTLQEELGVEPSPQTMWLVEQIRDGQLAAQIAKGRQSQVKERRHNLPAQLTPFVGREGELARIRDYLECPDCRLLTLVGPGGSGKTRLALQAAEAQLGRFADGVYFVPLATLESAETIVPTIAKALGFSFYSTAGSGASSTPRQQLFDYLREKSVLLVLDNFEHLLADHLFDDRSDAANTVADILKTARAVTVLATSRVSLNVQGEHRFPIAGLDFPERESPEDAFGYSAVKLFIEAARRARPTFELTGDDQESVAQICRLVDGMPLGILLAAAWVEILTPEEIGAEITQSLDILETDLRDVPERHRSMRAVFDHTWNLLSEREQEVFPRVSVFRGGFTREAMQRVTGASLRELMSLVSKSLLQPSRTGRYEVHELLRQYAAERLALDPESGKRTHHLHCAYYAEYLRQREAKIIAGRQRAALQEMDNVRAAWNWAVRQGKVAEIRAFCVPLMWICEVQGWYDEMEVLFGQAADALRVSGAVGERDVALGFALAVQSRGCRVLGYRAKAHSLVRESRSILSELGARQELAFCYAMAVDVGAVASPSEAEQLLRESLAIYTEMDVRWGMTFTLNVLGGAATHRGAYEEAKRYAQEALQISRELKSTRSMAWSLIILGDIAYQRKEYAAAKQFYQETLTLCRELGYQLNIGGRLTDLGRTAHAMGMYGEARKHYQQALTEWKRMGNPPATVWSLEGLGDVAVATGDGQGARQYYQQALEFAVERRFSSACVDVLVGLATLLSKERAKERSVELVVLVLNHPESAAETVEKVQELLDELRGQLPPDVFVAAQERGRSRELWATVEELLAELDGQPAMVGRTLCGLPKDQAVGQFG